MVLVYRQRIAQGFSSVAGALPPPGAERVPRRPDGDCPTLDRAMSKETRDGNVSVRTDRDRIGRTPAPERGYFAFQQWMSIERCSTRSATLGKWSESAYENFVKTPRGISR
jgi:hypothetical protein